MYGYLEFKLRHLKNLKLFSIRVKELFKAIVARERKKKGQRVFDLFKSVLLSSWFSSNGAPIWCESWILLVSVNIKNKINAVATSCYRIILGIKRLGRVKNTQIHETTNTQPLINPVRQRQLCFLGHILRMPEDEPCRRYIYSLCSRFVYQHMAEEEKVDNTLKGNATVKHV